MYSRDIFPRYSGGGLPIPENYSGNAIRPGRGTQGEAGMGEQTHIHTPQPRVMANDRSVKLSPSAAEREEERQAPPSIGSGQGEPLHGSMQGEGVPQFVSPPSEEGAGGGAGAPPDRDGFRGGGAEDGTFPSRERRAERDKEEPSRAASAHGHAPDGAGVSSILSTFLPPKPDGMGMLSQVGLEEALLLGLFLLLSQGEADEDTLMILALLFLYR